MVKIDITFKDMMFISDLKRKYPQGTYLKELGHIYWTTEAEDLINSVELSSEDKADLNLSKAARSQK